MRIFFFGDVARRVGWLGIEAECIAIDGETLLLEKLKLAGAELSWASVGSFFNLFDVCMTGPSRWPVLELADFEPADDKF